MLQLVHIAPCPFAVQPQEKCVNLLYIVMRELMCLKGIPETLSSKKSVIKLEQTGQKKARRTLGSNLNREVLKVNKLNLSVLELSLF